MGYDAASTADSVAVVGIGYVGVTLACALGNAGFHTIGYDINAERVRQVRQGHVPFTGAEPEMVDLLARLVSEQRLTATTEPAELRRARAVFVAVETPVEEEDHRPRYQALQAALAAVGPCLADGALVVIESTLAPGTMQRLVLPTLQQATGKTVGQQLFLVHCPERVMPGRLLRNISTCDRIVGGITPACTERGMAIYARVTSGTLYSTDALTAEIVKTAENAYRDVQIAFANEVALICEELGADAYEVRNLVNSSPYRHMHLPGAGVGGHCIPKDPWLLCSAVEQYQPRLLPTARAINDGMPLHLLDLVHQALIAEGRTLEGATVTILGVAYLEETDDIRNTPALALARGLVAHDATVRLVDPYVEQLEEFPVTPGEDAVAGSDALVLVTAHQQFRTLDLAACAPRMRTPILIDGRNVFSTEAATAAGFHYRAIGKGKAQRATAVTE